MAERNEEQIPMNDLVILDPDETTMLENPVPGEQDNRNEQRKYCTDKRFLCLGGLIAMLVVVGVVVAVTRLARPGTEMPGTASEYHSFVDNEIGTPCYKIFPPVLKDISEGTDGYKPHLVNSSCLLCNGQCLTREELKNSLGRIFCGSDAIDIDACPLYRDMLNMDDTVCGGFGKYGCASFQSTPHCNCDNNKVGESCMLDVKMTCWCWNKPGPVDVDNTLKNCSVESKKLNWAECFSLSFDKKWKCHCYNMSADLTLRDCDHLEPHSDKQTSGATKLGWSLYAIVRNILVYTLYIHWFRY